jgi:hypothetical protein
MRLGLNIEYEGKNYDILELPLEAFAQMIPGLNMDQLKQLDKYFEDFWPEPTLRRHHILEFAAEQVGASLDFLLLHRESIQFDESDMAQYVQEHTMQGNRPS